MIPLSKAGNGTLEYCASLFSSSLFLNGVLYVIHSYMLKDRRGIVSFVCCYGFCWLYWRDTLCCYYLYSWRSFTHVIAGHQWKHNRHYCFQIYHTEPNRTVMFGGNVAVQLILIPAPLTPLLLLTPLSGSGSSGREVYLLGFDVYPEKSDADS